MGLNELGHRARPVADSLRPLLRHPKTMVHAISAMESILGNCDELNEAKRIMVGSIGLRFYAQMMLNGSGSMDLDHPPPASAADQMSVYRAEQANRHRQQQNTTQQTMTARASQSQQQLPGWQR